MEECKLSEFFPTILVHDRGDHHAIRSRIRDVDSLRIGFMSFHGKNFASVAHLVCERSTFHGGQRTGEDSLRQCVGFHEFCIIDRLFDFTVLVFVLAGRYETKTTPDSEFVAPSSVP